VKGTKKILLILGISGSGKSTIETYLRELGVPSMISHTTRSPRQGEIPNKSYYYITKNQFDKLDKLEQTEYSGNFYCLSREELDRHEEDIVCAVVDYEGAVQIRDAYGEDNCVIVCLHIDYQTMEERLKMRGDSIDEIKKRINYAKDTNEAKKNYEIADFTIQNNKLEQTKQLIEYIVKGMKNEEEIIF